MNKKVPVIPLLKNVIQRIWDFNNNKTAGAPDQRPTHTDTPENAWDHSKLPTSQAVAEAIQAVQWNHEDFVEALRQRGVYPRAFTTEVGTGDKYNPDLPVTLVIDLNKYTDNGVYYLTSPNDNTQFMNGPDSDLGNFEGEVWPYDISTNANKKPLHLSFVLEVIRGEHNCEFSDKAEIFQRLTVMSETDAYNGYGRFVAYRYGFKDHNVTEDRIQWIVWKIQRDQDIPIKMTADTNGVIGNVYYSNGNHTLYLPKPFGYPVGSRITLIQNASAGKVVYTPVSGEQLYVNTETDTSDPANPVSMVYIFEIDYDETLHKSWKLVTDSNYLRDSGLDLALSYYVKFPTDFYDLNGVTGTPIPADTPLAQKKVVPWSTVKTFYEDYLAHKSAAAPHTGHLVQDDVRDLGNPPTTENLSRTALSFSSGNTINTNLTNLTNRFEEHRGYGQNPDPDPHTQYMRRGFGVRAGGAVWPIGYRLVYGDPASSPAYALSYQTPRIVNVRNSAASGLVIQLPKIGEKNASGNYTGIYPYDEILIYINRKDTYGKPIYLKSAEGDTICGIFTKTDNGTTQTSDNYAVIVSGDETEEYLSIRLVAISTSDTAGDWQPVGGRNTWDSLEINPLTGTGATIPHAYVNFINTLNVWESPEYVAPIDLDTP